VTIVRFPTKVRLTVVDGEDPEPFVGAALEAADAAFARAVEKAARLHLVRDARPDPTRRPLIDICFTGAALPPGLTTRLRKELARSIDAQVDSLITRPVAKASATSRVLNPNESAAETFDERKLLAERHDVDDAYLVPSYAGKGTDTALPLAGGSRSTAGQPHQPAPPTHLQLVDVQTRDQLQALIAKRFGGSPPPLFVAIYKINGLPTTVLLRVNPAGEVIDGLRIGQPRCTMGIWMRIRWLRCAPCWRVLAGWSASGCSGARCGARPGRPAGCSWWARPRRSHGT